MKFKFTDKIIGLLLFIELLYLFFISSFIYESLFDVYEGLSLFIYIFRALLYFGLGILTIILLFQNSLYSKWTFLSYMGIAFINKLWIIVPNTQKYYDSLREAQKTMQHLDPNNFVTISIKIYPYWWAIILYILALVYFFIIKKKYNPTLHD